MAVSIEITTPKSQKDEIKTKILKNNKKKNKKAKRKDGLFLTICIFFIKFKPS